MLMRTLRALTATCLMYFAVAAYADWTSAVPNARLLGQGTLRIWGFSVYDAQLWSAASPQQVITLSTPFALQLTYKRSLSRDDLVKASVKELRRLAPPSFDSQQLERWTEHMQRAFVDVAPGDQITGVFVPQYGARFYAGRTLQHEVQDPAFAEAFFMIWLDPRTRNNTLRTQLLGDNRL